MNNKEMTDYLAAEYKVVGKKVNEIVKALMENNEWEIVKDLNYSLGYQDAIEKMLEKFKEVE